MDEVKLRVLKEIQDKTYLDMLNQLASFGLCNVERPTGFGKTKLFMRYAEEHPQQRLLYIYDTTSSMIDIREKYDPQNVGFMSYRRISFADCDELIQQVMASRYDVIIFDESHLMGGLHIREFCAKIIPLLVNDGVFVLGGTATCVRSDMVNVTTTFFAGHTVFEYTLDDAINDGIIINPYWTIMVMVSKILADLKNMVAKNPYQQKRLTQLDQAYAHVIDAPHIYRDAVKSVHGEVPDHMRFICFFPTIQSIKDNMDQMAQDFQMAFPGHLIRTAAISSDDEHYHDITTLEQDIEDRPTRHIDLIFAVQMLNQAYHSDDLTGIVMNRTTMSNIIFTQQLGRCLSVTSNQQAIVFDNVNNAYIDPSKVLDWVSLQTGEEPAGEEESDSECMKRTGRKFHVNVDPKVLDLLQWYVRIKATKELTQEQIDYARE